LATPLRELASMAIWMLFAAPYIQERKGKRVLDRINRIYRIRRLQMGRGESSTTLRNVRLSQCGLRDHAEIRPFFNPVNPVNPVPILFFPRFAASLHQRRSARISIPCIL
jgi:hypothetical protein